MLGKGRKTYRKAPNKGRKLSREGGNIKFDYFSIEQSTLTGSEKAEAEEKFHSLQVLGMNDDLWDRDRGLGCELWKWCERIKLLVGRTRLIRLYCQ